jgi:hypothetical protein
LYITLVRFLQPQVEAHLLVALEVGDEVGVQDGERRDWLPSSQWQQFVEEVEREVLVVIGTKKLLKHDINRGLDADLQGAASHR